MAKFAIGQQFTKRGKVYRLCTVIDVLTTFNAAGELVKTSYVATHHFMGQTITEHDVCETTIAMGVQ